MPFDDEKFDGPASGGDVGSVAIASSLAIDALIRAIRAIKDGQDPEEHLARAKEMSDALDKDFDELTGYTKA